MIIGNYLSKLAANGRTAFPSKFRQELGDHVVLLQGYERCLVLVTPQSLDQIISNDHPFALTAAREAQRFLLGNAFEVEMDAQGRFVIPQSLRTYANLQHNEVIFVGTGNRIEVWNPQDWDEHQRYLQEHSIRIADNLTKIQSIQN